MGESSAKQQDEARARWHDGMAFLYRAIPSAGMCADILAHAHEMNAKSLRGELCFLHRRPALAHEPPDQPGAERTGGT